MVSYDWRAAERMAELRIDFHGFALRRRNALNRLHNTVEEVGAICHRLICVSVFVCVSVCLSVCLCAFVAIFPPCVAVLCLAGGGIGTRS